MGYNLSELTQEEKDKINVSLAASGVAFKERYNMPVVADAVLREQPQELHAFFQERLMFYRARSQHYSRLPYEPQAKK
ncbi:DNA polymerase III subunit theta [Proteus vulgaris]|uniref:DNA polymerase III subunit theta n=1 Tax=Proteus vulgaris TaxID=585 RepID=UPI0018E467FD|nr:DNA polymerase III subunit theta [Proteus vulgaris]MBI6529800.1 DNA polymerase III subunit theta [Proteus vulgaris]